MLTIKFVIHHCYNLFVGPSPFMADPCQKIMADIPVGTSWPTHCSDGPGYAAGAIGGIGA